MTPTGGKQVVGAATFEATTEVNTDTHTVFMFNINVLNTYFPIAGSGHFGAIGSIVPDVCAADL